MNVKELIQSNPEVLPDIKPVDKVEIGEIISERTANAKVFSLGGNKRRAKVYLCPIHYKDADGKFKIIDDSVKKNILNEYRVDSGLWKAKFDKDKPWNYRFEVGDKWIEYEALFEESENLKIDIETSKIGIKETITLLDDKAPVEFRWRFSASGIIPTPPFAIDSNNNDVPITQSIKDDILTYKINNKNAVYPIIVDPTSIEATNDGTARVFSGANYVAARDPASGEGVGTSFIQIGQRGAPNWGVFRGFLEFALPEMGSVTACSLFLDGLGDASATDFNVYIHTSIYSDTLAVADFSKFDGRQTGQAHDGTILNDAWSTSGWIDGWNELVFNAAGKAAALAAQNGDFKIAMISSRDYSNTSPSDTSYTLFEPSGTADKEPYLSITYTPSRAISGTLTPTGALARALTAYKSSGGTLTPSGALAAAIFIEQALGGELTLDGELSGSNPAWLILDDALVWMGEWDTTWSYNVDDVVLHKAGDEWHVFVSKIGHNVGNPPNSSAEAWHRLYQEQLL